MNEELYKDLVELRDIVLGLPGGPDVPLDHRVTQLNLAAHLSDMVQGPTRDEDKWFDQVGTGRVGREAYIFRLGSRQIDVDELRTFVMRKEIEDKLRQMHQESPITGAEAMWLLEWFKDMPYYQRFKSVLFRICEEKNDG